MRRGACLFPTKTSFTIVSSYSSRYSMLRRGLFAFFQVFWLSGSVFYRRLEFSTRYQFLQFLKCLHSFATHRHGIGTAKLSRPRATNPQGYRDSVPSFTSARTCKCYYSNARNLCLMTSQPSLIHLCPYPIHPYPFTCPSVVLVFQSYKASNLDML